MGSSLPLGHTASPAATILLHMNYKIGLIALAFIISFFQTVFICTFSIGRIVWSPFRNCCGVNPTVPIALFDLKEQTQIYRLRRFF